jgi:hypothetical protein
MSGRTVAEARLLRKLSLFILGLKLDSFITLLERHYNPDQPRVPAGNPDGGEWTSGGGESLPASSGTAATLLVAGSTKNFDYACGVLKLNRNKASDILHAVKEDNGLGGADNCTFDTDTGDILYNGEVIGNLRDRP